MNSLRENLLHAAGRAAEARPTVAARAAAFVRGQTCPGGGFADRAGRPDLYYTVFGLQTLAAIEARPFEPTSFEPAAEAGGHPRSAGDGPDIARQTRAYLATFDADDLDFVTCAASRDAGRCFPIRPRPMGR